MGNLDPIRQKIYEIRGQRVMLDFDLAYAYGVDTSQLKRQVRRNIERFEGEDFMFEFTREELSRCQIGTMNIKRGQNIKYLPFAFTELGVAMLSSVLRTPSAIQVNRSIMRAFVEFRHLASSLPLPDTSADIAQLRKDFEELKLDIEDILHDQNDINESTRLQLENITLALAEMQAGTQSRKPRRKIGFRQDREEN